MTPAGLEALAAALAADLARDGASVDLPRSRHGDLTVCTSGDCSIRLALERLDLSPALVVAVEGPAGWARREMASPGWTRGMHVALVRAGGIPFVLDLGVRARPTLRMAPFATPLR